jgi:ribosomal protein S18 acetylase RimI-like enzyme
MKTSIIRVLKSGDETALEAFLMPRVESSMFLIGNLRNAGIIDNGQIYNGTYSAKIEDGRIVGAVAHYWNHNLVLQAQVDLVALCKEVVKGSGRPIKGIIGPNSQVQFVKSALKVEKSNIQMDETERLYSLDLKDLIIPENLRSGRVKARRIERADVRLLTKWKIAYAVEALGAEDGQTLLKQSEEDSERSVREKRTWILEQFDKPVACSSFNTKIKEAVQVGGVWTPPDLRRQGYGRAVVAASLLDARDDGAIKGVLFTGDDNIAAQKAYESLGFRPIGDYSIVLLKSPLEQIVW